MHVHTSYCRAILLINIFPIIADETTDVANDEQLSICIHYVEEGVPQEKFVAFHECVSGVTGEAIKKNHLKPYCLAATAILTSWRGYDGAGGMSGLSNVLLGDWHDAWVSMLPIQEHGFIREHLEMLFVCAMVGSLTCFLRPVFLQDIFY